MRILLYDNDPDELESLYYMLTAISDEFHIDKVLDTNQGQTLYEKYTYEYVFINTDCNNGRLLIELISKDNPKQNLIALSDSITCTDNLKCEFCKEEENKFLLVRPIYSNDLFYILLGKIKRPNYCDNNHMLMKLKKIDQTFANFDLCIESSTFINKNSFLKRDELMGNILTQLHIHDIEYEIDQTKNIKIKHKEE